MLYQQRFFRMYKEKYFPTSPSIDVMKLRTWFEQPDIAKKLVIFDVRTQKEIQEGFISSSSQDSRPTIFFDYFSEQLIPYLATLDPASVYCVYCRAGVRSLGALYYMRKAGITDAYNLSGGILAWKAAGYPLSHI